MLSMPRVSVRFQRCFASFRLPPQTSNACITGTWRLTAFVEAEVVLLAAHVADALEDVLAGGRVGRGRGDGRAERSRERHAREQRSDRERETAVSFAEHRF